jgi:hypothetical protein
MRLKDFVRGLGLAGNKTYVLIYHRNVVKGMENPKIIPKILPSLPHGMIKFC